MKSLATLSLTLLAFLSFAQPNTTSNRFWMAYMDNITLMFNGDPAFGVWISSDTEVVGTISVPQTGLTIEFDGGPGSFEVPFPEAIWYSEASQVISNKGILIETDVPVNATGIHYRAYFSDGSSLLPETLLGDEYRILAAEDINGIDPSAMVILATEDNTEIEITPSTLTTELSPGGVPFTITMDEGQIYQVKAQSDLTGSTVRAVNGEKIAVFAGAQMAAIGCTGENSHLWDQQIPIDLLGTAYPVIPYLNQGTNDFKVVAIEDETEVYLDCSDPINLNAGEFHVFSAIQPDILRSNKPVQFGQYNRTSDCNPGNAGPSFAVLHPLTNRSTGQTIYASNASGLAGQFFSQHSINLLVNSGDEGDVTVNGAAVNWTPVPDNPQFLYAKVDIPAGQNSFTAPAGAWVQAASFGDFDACTYSCGFDVVVEEETGLTLAALGNPTTDGICENEEVFFSYNTEQEISQGEWDFAGLGTSFEDNPSFTFSEAGTYEVYFTALANGCPITAVIEVVVQECETVGINDNSLENTLQYAGGVLQYSGATAVDIFVFASNGQLVASSVLQAGSQWDITALSQGVYTAVIGNGKERATLRFYLER